MSSLTDTSIKVGYRCRALTTEELNANLPSATYISNNQIISISPDRTNQNTYDSEYTYDSTCINEKIFLDMVNPLITNTISGYNNCFIVTGSPSSGKTFTLFGNSSQTGILRRVFFLFK